MYKIIAVSGVDAVDFLQGQLTQDIGKLAVGKCLPCAWCNASGRVVMTLKILAAGDEFLLVVPDTVAEAATPCLTGYSKTTSE